MGLMVLVGRAFWLGLPNLMTKEKGFPWHLCHVPRPLGCSTGSVSPSIAFSGFPKYQPLRLQLFSEMGTFGVLMRSCRQEAHSENHQH